MSTVGDTDGTKAALRAALIEAERECQQRRADDYVARIIRDTRIVKAHCGGMSQKEISALVGDMGQPFDRGDGRVAPVGVCC